MKICLSSSASVHTKLLGCFNIYVSRKLPTYTPPPPPPLANINTSHLRQNVGLGEGWVDSFPETYNDPSPPPPPLPGPFLSYFKL